MKSSGEQKSQIYLPVSVREGSLLCKLGCGSSPRCEVKMDVTKTGNGERGAGNGERKSGNELSAETSTKIQNGGPKNEREKEEDKERNLCLG